jgi:hypothetical protein
MAENLERPAGERKCKYLEIKVIQGIKHQNCFSPRMIEINKPKDGRPLPCMGCKCGCIEFE